MKNIIFYIKSIIAHILEYGAVIKHRKIQKRKSKMANIKSSKKRVLIAERNRLRNVAMKSSIKTAIKNVLELSTSDDKEALNAALSKAYQLCDKAVSKGILHKNTAARKKSRLTKAVNKNQAK